ncbi:MAG: hypothetical protein QOE61_4943, partial [Micromonosporaceae bacterium]|nr:hypothetical protein [Micromonosporaceae bacterium]
DREPRISAASSLTTRWSSLSEKSTGYAPAGRKRGTVRVSST